MSCDPSGVLQPLGLSEGSFLHAAKLSSSPQFNMRWANAESRISELLSRIQPNGHSELQRKAVADYVSGLVHKCLDCEVFKFGSVPLKTYLPDGDIDLTAFSSHRELRDTWALDVQTVLEHEEQRRDGEFRVTKVQCIHAEVKIVKCVVENVVVDISFNQLGGLCTLCFLEEVDRLIQKNHLFKRSIILVKAWCYYESRILGAHHGLISTYALETLVLYIFNVFHSTLRGPLEVLFTFLNYFSNFDWEKYCVSLWGPVALASLPDLTAEPPLKDGRKLLLSEDFLELCNALYDVFPKGQDTQARTFSGKFLNIVDPLRNNNNLGRSVSQANYHRIRSAFHLGARKLVKVFDCTDEDFPKYLDEFFSNTWERHQSGHRPDAPASSFPPYQMFVFKAECLDMLDNDSANNTVGLLESEKSTLPSSEKILKDSKTLSSHSHLSILVEDISTETAGGESRRDVCLQDSNTSKGFLEKHVINTNQTHSYHGGITDPTFGVGDPMPSTTKGCVNTQSTLACNMPLAVSADSHLKASSLRSSCSGASMTSKQRPDVQASLKRTVSEGRKNLHADIVKSCRLPEDEQDFNIRKSTSENDSKEIWKSGSSPLGGLAEAAKTSSGNSNVSALNQTDDKLALMHTQNNGKLGVIRGKGCKSWPTLDSCENSSGSSATSNDTTIGCPSFIAKTLTASDTVPQKPPELLFPESRDLLHGPSAHSFSLPSFSSSTASCVLVPSPFFHPLSFPELDTGVAKTAPVHATTVQVTLPTVPIGVPQWPVPPPLLASYEGLQNIARPMPLFNGMNASGTPIQHQSLKEVGQQPHFWQQPGQDQLPPFKPVQPLSHLNASASEVFPVSQVVGLERNGTDLSFPNSRPMPHAEARRSGVVSNSTGKASFRNHEAVPSHVKVSAKTVKSDDKMQPRRQEVLDAQILSRVKEGLYEESEGATKSLPALASDLKADVHLYSPSVKTASKPFYTDGHRLPGYAPSFDQPCLATSGLSEATIPGSKEVVDSVSGAANQPVDYVDTSQSLLFGTCTATGSIVKEGGNQMAQGTRMLYFPIGAVPTVSYYNPFYPVSPSFDHEFQACRLDSSDHHVPYEDKTGCFLDVGTEGNPSQVFHGSGRNPKSNAALSARFASLSAEEGEMEPPRDLLRSDLTIHRRNLEFGRWCQEPVLLESSSMYHSAQGPFLWGVSPFTPVQGFTGPFNQVLGDVNGLIPMASSPQIFGGMPYILPWPGTSEISDLSKHYPGTGRFLPSRNGKYKDLKSWSPHIAAQYDLGTPQGRHGDMNTWRKTHSSTISHPSAAPALVASPSHCGVLNGINAFGRSNNELSAVATNLPNHSPGRAIPLVAGQLEFGSLGPIDILSFPDDDVGSKEFKRFSTGDTSSGFSSTFSDSGVNQTLLNTPR
eukprot:c24895_g1_i1 orf=465-4658(-)